MTKSLLPQKYQEAARAIIPYNSGPSEQITLIKIEPALPCFICGQPALAALTTPAPAHLLSISTSAWLIFPICAACEERQIGA